MILDGDLQQDGEPPEAAAAVAANDHTSSTSYDFSPGEMGLDDQEASEEEEEEEEAECRVCRGPAEEGRPLFSPCKCSGSIGLCHQDCLSSWLEVTHSGGKCVLPFLDSSVAIGVARRAAVMHGVSVSGLDASPGSIRGRWDWDLIAPDGVAGAVVAAVVVVSFLSLMSLADFMRFQWNPNPNQDLGEGAVVAEADGAGAGVDNGGHENEEERRAAAGAAAAMPEPFEVDARDGVPMPQPAAPPAAAAAADAAPHRPPRHHHYNHHRGQRQRQRNLVPPVEQGVDDGFLGNVEGHREEAQRGTNSVTSSRKDLEMHRSLDESDGIDDGDGRQINRLVAELGAHQRRDGSFESVEERGNGVHTHTNGAAELRGNGVHTHTNGATELAVARARNDAADDDDSSSWRNYEMDGASSPTPYSEPPSPPPPEGADLEPDEAALLEDMMRAQEEAMLGLDSDDENDGVDHPVPGADQPAQQGQRADQGAPENGARPQNIGARRQGGGLFPLDGELELDEDMDMDGGLFPLDEELELDEDMDMEFQVALDELLGFRGPVGALIRNLLWVLAFVTTYIGLFGFLPYRLGAAFSKSRSFALMARLLHRQLSRFPVEGLFDATPSPSPIDRFPVEGLFDAIVINATSTTTTNESSIVSSLCNTTILGLSCPDMSNAKNLTAALNQPAAALIESAATTVASNTTRITETTVMLNITVKSALDACVLLLFHLNDESRRLNTLFRLPDISKLVLGYFVIAAIVFSWRGLILLYTALRKNINKQDSSTHEDAGFRRVGQNLVAEGHDGNARIFDDDVQAAAEQMQQDDDVIEIKLSVIFDCAVSVLKVCILLFLKMLILPLVLGILLDCATLELFDAKIQSRVQYAGADLFGGLLIHWVAGITFMLFVTVSVLQLREVIHPDLLARIIRPQEPQPDLLGNLLKERGFTHAKRMLVSLSIYIALLAVNVWLPSKCLALSGISSYVPVFRPRFWRIVLPQLQVPLELLVFHLSMLAVLEKYKNFIGQLQHKWLVFMCGFLGLTDCLLPRDVDGFVLVGSKPLFRPSNDDSKGILEATFISGEATAVKTGEEPEAPTGSKELDPFWTELISLHKKNDLIDGCIVAHVNADDAPTSCVETGVTNSAGRRVLDASKARIRLPMQPGDTPFYEDEVTMKKESTFLPTSIGAYRFRLSPSTESDKLASSDESIEIWKEVCGNPTPRPPEGWDDLGAGGAEVQGRWAWNNEAKSKIEEGIAQRSVFFESRAEDENRITSAVKHGVKGLYLILKVVVLVILSWMAMSVTIFCGISAPLVTGRFIFFLLQLPVHFIHDPIAYTIGGATVFPIVFKIQKAVTKREDDVSRCLLNWASSFRLPPQGSPKLGIVLQALILWFAVIPLLVGLIYHLFFVKGPSFWLHNESLLDATSLAFAWGVGTMLMNAWAALCFINAFKSEFWLNIVFVGDPAAAGGGVADAAAGAGAGAGAAPVAPNNANNDADGGDDNDDASDHEVAPSLASSPMRLQGKDGLVARFSSVLYAILGKWEWDKVDRDILLGQSLVPLVQQLLILFVGPIVAFLGWSKLLSFLTRGRGRAGIILPYVGFVERGLYLRFFYRFFVLTTLSIQLASVGQKALQRWFRAAHSAARNDRYLIGEVLMNYVRQPSN
eukprot:CAMPEP_0178537610 /NCGR_PEP_ID=MMETSP0696-20121128/36682_1 /TAXON_ID=265572 /ORGANISM="Extubocellulus spinifer, Strain CCMP396" /LENGTH=1644 /DNA_ID=CAMNT_0020169851 /DNA_START=16 /DNA_END=4953 /DNA_ORIENTATION=-